MQGSSEGKEEAPKSEASFIKGVNNLHDLSTSTPQRLKVNEGSSLDLDTAKSLNRIRSYSAFEMSKVEEKRKPITWALGVKF